jgi:hypothetical protein
MFAKKRPPFSTSAFLFGAGALGFFGFIFTVASSDFFTPAHTNSFSLYGSLIAHLSLVMTGGLLGL